MTAGTDTRRVSLLLVMAVIVVAVVVPTCQMVGCTMSSMPAMPFFGGHGLSMTAPCDGTFVVNGSPLGVIPVSLGSFVLVLLAALVVAASPLFTSLASRLAVIEVAEPPPRLGGLGGELLRV